MSDSDFLEQFIADCRRNGEMDDETEGRLRRLVAVFSVQSKPDLVRLIGSFAATLSLTTAYRNNTNAVRVLSDQLEQFPEASTLQHKQNMNEAAETYRQSIVQGAQHLKKVLKDHDDAFSEKYATKEEFVDIHKKMEKLMQSISNSASVGLTGGKLLLIAIFLAAIFFFIGAYTPRWWL